MLPFIVVGALGLVILLAALIFDQLFDFLDGAISGTGLGAALTAFGAVGMIVVAFDLPEWLAYLLSAVLAVLVLVLVQLLLRTLRRSEDGTPSSPVGLYGTARSVITVAAGEVSLDGAYEIETRMAFSDVRIEPGTRIRVIEVQGPRVKVESAATAQATDS